MGNIRGRIDYILKHNLFLQKIYKVFMSACFRLLGLFIPIDEKLILFNGHGRKYNDSPKEIFKCLASDEKYSGYKFVWALDDPEQYNIPNASKVKMDTLQYFITALKSQYWITCVNIERGLQFKKKRTILLNTWHGTPLKLIGNAVSGRKDFDFSNINYFCYAGKYEKGIYMRDFNIPEESLVLSGLPRNDELYHVTQEKIKMLKKKLDIPLEKKVILYAPTWRDSRDNGKNYSIQPPIDVGNLQNELQKEYILLLRTHAYTNKIMGVEFNDFVRDFSSYPEVNDLLILADILISDYSATIFDFSILERPIICFGYDYFEYLNDRGFYIDLQKELPSGVIKRQDDLVQKIKNMNYEEECKKTKLFKNKFIETNGNATEVCIAKLFE